GPVEQCSDMNGGSSLIVAALRSLQICGTLCSCRATGRGWREANLIASHHPRRFMRRACYHELMVKVRTEEFTLVTNNAVDFRRLCRHEAIHPSLVILIPNAMPSVQRAVFS